MHRDIGYSHQQAETVSLTARVLAALLTIDRAAVDAPTATTLGYVDYIYNSIFSCVKHRTSNMIYICMYMYIFVYIYIYIYICIYLYIYILVGRESIQVQFT